MSALQRINLGNISTIVFGENFGMYFFENVV